MSEELKKQLLRSMEDGIKKWASREKHPDAKVDIMDAIADEVVQDFHLIPKVRLTLD